MASRFTEQLYGHFDAGKFLCIGLDTCYADLPHHLTRERAPSADTLLNFNLSVIDATLDIACAYKLNLAPYLMGYLWGDLDVLRKIINYIICNISDARPLAILDGKFGDVGHTNMHNAKFAFTEMNADAVTLSPYLGFEDSLEPFFENKDKGKFIVCRTTNAGGARMQVPQIFDPNSGKKIPYYVYVAKEVATRWSKGGNCGLVVGGTGAHELKTVRDAIGYNIPILSPGLGFQGGTFEKALGAGLDADGTGALLLSASRSIVNVSKDRDYLEKVRQAALSANEKIVRFRKKLAEKCKHEQ
jgi:orotidine-5'-phosphate decarboxylase